MRRTSKRQKNESSRIDRGDASKSAQSLFHLRPFFRAPSPPAERTSNFLASQRALTLSPSLLPFLVSPSPPFFFPCYPARPLSRPFPFPFDPLSLASAFVYSKVCLAVPLAFGRCRDLRNLRGTRLRSAPRIEPRRLGIEPRPVGIEPRLLAPGRQRPPTLESGDACERSSEQGSACAARAPGGPELSRRPQSERLASAPAEDSLKERTRRGPANAKRTPVFVATSSPDRSICTRAFDRRSGVVPDRESLLRPAARANRVRTSPHRQARTDLSGTKRPRSIVQPSRKGQKGAAASRSSRETRTRKRGEEAGGGRAGWTEGPRSRWSGEGRALPSLPPAAADAQRKRRRESHPVLGMQVAGDPANTFARDAAPQSRSRPRRRLREKLRPYPSPAPPAASFPRPAAPAAPLSPPAPTAHLREIPRILRPDCRRVS